MTFARIAIVEYRPGIVEQLLPRVDGELLPALQRASGFIGYIAYRAGNVVTSIASYDNRESAEQAVHLAAEWLERSGLASGVNWSQVRVGELIFDSEEVAKTPGFDVEHPVVH